MSKRIIFTRSNGDVTIRNLPSNATDDDFKAAIEHAKTPRIFRDGTTIPPKAVDEPAIFEDVNYVYSKLFRKALERVGDKPVMNMTKARVIKTDIVRIKRDERLVALDVDYIRADETSNIAEKQRITDVKQKLRDLPATIQPDLDIILTTEELEAYVPTILQPEGI